MASRETWTIDRFEGEYAILAREQEMFQVPRQLLPADAAEGDVLQVTWGIGSDFASWTMERDATATAERQRKWRRKIDGIEQPPAGGDSEA